MVVTPFAVQRYRLQPNSIDGSGMNPDPSLARGSNDGLLSNLLYLRCLGPRGMDFMDKIKVQGNDRSIGYFQPGSVIYIESLKLQAGRLRSHVNTPMTDLGLKQPL